ncbi:hypothetical protein HDU96_006208 [Phlyctochytrium bullatum]|nr:hypothetical protein HDU96_006208 [Phlyctochytrium bullatum]
MKLLLLTLLVPLASASSQVDTTSNYCSVSGASARRLKGSDSDSQPNGAIQDTFCRFETVDEVNKNIFTQISELVTTTFFKYYKVDLTKECPFWPDDRRCMNRDCAVQEVTDENLIPSEWKTAALSDVDFSTVDTGFGLFQKKCEYSDKDFCVVEDESSNEGVYVDLLKNPERFTGYAGDSATRVWKAVYTENCFEKTDKTGAFPGMDGEYLNCFLFRVGKHPDRIENLYFTYAVLLRSIAKLAPYLRSYKWCTGNLSDEHKIKALVEQIVEQSLSCPATFDEKLMFADSSSTQLKDEFKLHFRNVSKIMDCVGCEKCRLWGKLQVSGMGTALKILFSFGDNPKEFKLSRSELVALINGFGRLSDSIEAVNRFRSQMIFLEQDEAKTPTDSSNNSEDSKLGSLDLSFTSFDNPRFLVSFGLGLIILIAGTVRILQKGYQLEKGTLELPEGHEEYQKSEGDATTDKPQNGSLKRRPVNGKVKANGKR